MAEVLYMAAALRILDALDERREPSVEDIAILESFVGTRSYTVTIEEFVYGAIERGGSNMMLFFAPRR